MAGEVVRTLNFDIEEKSIQLQLQIEPLIIEADEQLLRQALFNLVLNAIQAVPARGSSSSAPAGATMKKPSSRFLTTAPACPPKTARKFSSPTLPPMRKGPDWAWPSCSKSSWPTAGRSNVCPMSRPRAFPPGAHQSQEQGLKTVPPESSNSTTPRLLIVDDDAAQRSLLDSFLSSQGFDTVPVSSGQRALEVLREQKSA